MKELGRGKVIQAGQVGQAPGKGLKGYRGMENKVVVLKKRQDPGGLEARETLDKRRRERTLKNPDFVK